MNNFDVQKILVPIDFSELTGGAIEVAQALARRFEARVHLACVHQFFYPSGFITPAAPLSIPMATYDDDAVARETRDLKLLAKRYDLPAKNCRLLTGAPVFDEICRFAQELPADLIVMGTHSPAGLDRLLEGSTAERIVQHAPCPVLVTRASKGKAASGKIDSILVPVDFSPYSLRALEYAIQFAERAAARLIILHAVQFGWALGGGEPGVYQVAPMREGVRKQAGKEMAGFVRQAKFRAVRFETLVKIGPPVGEICAVAEDCDVDLIITATHGRTGFAHLLIGSVAEQVVRHADRPVLVVPSHPEKRNAAFPERAPSSSKQAAKESTPRARDTRARVTKKNLKLAARPAPARRKINKFRESHSA